MKKTFKTILVIATVAMASVSCQKETLKEAAQTTGMVTFSFTADLQQPKTTLTTTDDAAFAAAWKVGDKMTLFYTDKIAEDGTKQVEAVYGDGKFTFEVPAEVAGRTASWDYRALYEGVEASLFTRTQAGNAFNGDSEILNGTTEVSSAEFGKGISFSMDRLTSVLYFHLTNRGSAITEPITKAILTAGEGEVLAAKGYEVKEGHLVAKGEAEKSNKVTLNVTDGVAMNDADGIQLWFNVLPGKYSKLNLVVETASYRFTIDTKDAQDGYTLAEGGLTKIVGKVKNNYELKEGEVVFGDNVFDNCDYSPYVTGATVNCAAYPVLDTQNKKEGTGCYSFDMKADAGKLIGPASIKRGEAMPANGAYNDYLSFWIYTDKAIDMTQPNTFLIAELSTSGTFDTEEYQWTYFNTKLNVGWNEVKLYFKDATASAVAPDLTKGFNFFRVYIQEPAATEGDAYTIKIDDIKVIPSDYVAITTYPKDQNGNAVSGLMFRNTHPVFSKDKKTAYVSSTVGHIVAIDLTTGLVKWVYKPSTTSGCKTICVNPINGDIYGHNNNSLIYAVTADGSEHWVKSGFKPFGSSFAVSCDGSVVFAAGGNNRQILALDASNGNTLYEMTQAKDGGNFYTVNAQIVVFDQDADYDYIANQGNELISVIRHHKTTHKMEVLNWVKAQSKKTDDSGVANHACMDITSAAVGPDKKHVYFLGGAVDKTYCEIFTIDMSNAKTAESVQSGSTRLPIKYAITQKTVKKAVSGLVFDKDNNAYVTTAKYVKKFSEESLIAGGELSAIYSATVSGADDNSLNFLCPSVAASGNVYLSCVKGSPAGLYKVPAAGATTATKVCDSPLGTTTDFQGVFAMTDGYVVISSQAPAGLYVKKVDETISPNTWGYFGGDPCGSKNATLVYGN